MRQTPRSIRRCTSERASSADRFKRRVVSRGVLSELYEDLRSAPGASSETADDREDVLPNDAPAKKEPFASFVALTCSAVFFSAADEPGERKPRLMNFPTSPTTPRSSKCPWRSSYFPLCAVAAAAPAPRSSSEMTCLCTGTLKDSRSVCLVCANCSVLRMGRGHSTRRIQRTLWTPMYSSPTSVGRPSRRMVCDTTRQMYVCFTSQGQSVWPEAYGCV